MKLARHTTPLVADVVIDDMVREAFRPFDLDPDIPTEFFPFQKPSDIPDSFTIGVIVGGSGTGKSTLLNEFGQYTSPEWLSNLPIVSHFATVEDARECLHAVGLNSIPIWRLPYYALSNGQKFRADLARSLYDGSVIDEYTSVVDRSVAISASKSLRNHLDRSGVRNIVISTCHRDVLDWLQPDWVIDTDAGDYVLDYTVSRPKWWMEYLKEDKSVGRILLTR